MTWLSIIMFASVCILIDSRSPKYECNNVMRPIMKKFVFKLIYKGNIFHSFRKVIVSLRHSKQDTLTNFWKNHSAIWSVTVLSSHAGNFCGILGIHPIKSFSRDKLLWFGQKIELSYTFTPHQWYKVGVKSLS